MATNHSVIYEYDFALDGGAIGDIPLRIVGGDGHPPVGAILEGKNISVDVLTAVVGSGASAALKLDGAADIQAVAAVSGAPWSTTGIKDPTLEAGLKAAGGVLRLTVSAAVLTAGKFRVYLPYQTLT